MCLHVCISVFFTYTQTLCLSSCTGTHIQTHTHTCSITCIQHIFLIFTHCVPHTYTYTCTHHNKRIRIRIRVVKTKSVFLSYMIHTHHIVKYGIAWHYKPLNVVLTFFPCLHKNSTVAFVARTFAQRITMRWIPLNILFIFGFFPLEEKKYWNLIAKCPTIFSNKNNNLKIDAGWCDFFFFFFQMKWELKKKNSKSHIFMHSFD